MTGLHRPVGVPVTSATTLQVPVESLGAEASATAPQVSVESVGAEASTVAAAPQIRVEPICCICDDRISTHYGTVCLHMCMCHQCASEQRRRELLNFQTPRCPICMQENPIFVNDNGDEA